jgi:lysophospholipase L1-like esterase
VMVQVGEAQRAVRAERRRLERGLIDVSGSALRLARPVPVMTTAEHDAITITDVAPGTGGGAATSQITSSVLVPPTDAAFLVSGTALTAYAGGATYYRWGGITTIASMPYSVEFMYHGQAFELLCNGAGMRYRLWVDGKARSLTPTEAPTADNQQHLLMFDFGSVAERHVRIEAHFFYFGGVRREPTGTLWAPPVLAGPRIVVLGDSYTQGTGGLGIDNPATWLAYYLGCLDTFASGVGGTGYENPGSGGTVKFQDRVVNDVVDQHPDIVYVCGGINDTGYGGVVIGAAAETLFGTILDGVPGVTLIATGPWQPNAGISSNQIAARDAIQTALQAAGGHLFIDNLGGETVAGGSTLPWITGTGKVGSPTGSGNADVFISSDGVHPSPDGHRYHGSRLASDTLAWVRAGAPKGATATRGVITEWA